MKRPRERAIRQNLAAFPSSVTAWKRAAQLEGLSLSSWARRHLDPAARKALRRAGGDGPTIPKCRAWSSKAKQPKPPAEPELMSALDLLLGSGEK